MKKINLLTSTLAVLILSIVSVTAFTPEPVFSQSAAELACQGSVGSWANGECSVTDGSTLPEIIANVLNVLLVIIGVAAVVMLIIGGIRFVVSQGDPSAIEGARNTILYAVIGIVVAFLAWAAVNFVVGRLENPDADLTSYVETRNRSV